MCTKNSIGVISLAKPVKKGFLKRYKKGLLWSSKWRKEWIVLHEDSSLEWYKDESEQDFEDGFELKEAPEMIAAGPFANYVPGKPDLPKGTDPNCLMVFSNKAKDKLVWFLASNTDDLEQWMTAISNTLPPPPAPQQQQQQKQNQDQSKSELPTDMPPPYNATPTAPPFPNAQNNTHQVNQPPRMNGAAPAGNGRGYGGTGAYMGGGGGHGGRGSYMGGGGGGQNTVIIDRGNDGMGNFASGMLMGTALSGWGSGFGWGLGPRFGGWGCGVGFGIGPPVGHGYGNTGVNITNNITNTSTNNNEANNNNNNGNPPEGDPPEGDPPTNPEVPTEGDGSVDPGLDTGVDSNGFEPGFEPDAGAIPDAGIDPGLLDNGGLDMQRMEMPETNIDPGGYDMGGGGYDMGGGGFEMDGGGFDMGGDGFDMGGGGFDMGGGGFDMGGGGFDMGGGGFDMGGMDFGF